MTIGERLKSKREQLGIGQTDLAKRVGVTKQTLYKYENGIVTNIPSDVIERLAEELNCSPSYIMGWEESSKHRIEAYAKRLSEMDETDLDNVIKYIDFLESQKGRE
jgi:transcriptional regulator with XRE-family HTH domain